MEIAMKLKNTMQMMAILQKMKLEEYNNTKKNTDYNTNSKQVKQSKKPFKWYYDRLGMW